MNDHELDELLKEWKTPPPASSWRNRIRGAFTSHFAGAKRPRFQIHWRTAFGGTLAAAFVCFLAVSVAFPQVVTMLPFSSAPFIVDARCDVQRDNGVKTMYIESYEMNGRLIEGPAPLPDDDVFLRLHHALLGVRMALIEFHESIALHVGATQPSPWFAMVKRGCANSPSAQDAVLGSATLLGYETVGVRHSDGDDVVTTWDAKALDCFPLKLKIESRRPDGSLAVVRDQTAYKVTLNR